LSHETVDPEIGPKETFNKVAEHIRQIKGFPIDQQVYFCGGNSEKLDISSNFIDLQIAMEDVDLKLILKPLVHINLDGETFDIYPEFSDKGYKVVEVIANMKGLVE